MVGVARLESTSVQTRRFSFTPGDITLSRIGGMYS
ncbi:hypothetical protein F383_34417 [Gossypium arboreum]|uniref:Uncharacterized protein n=1 Tax=Gossypium arboreum TaxID=29729 RepID=A0A0B0N491_GOSAR|nr:hypothetical protein F383_34417 [Gossypium arboreum]